MSGGPRSDAHEARAQLVVIAGPEIGRKFVVDGAVTIGRGDDVDILIDDSEVSRRHACISMTDDGYVLEDLESRNGTFIGDQRLHGSCPIGFGDTVSLGTSVRLLFTHEEPREEQIRQRQRMETLGRLAASVTRDLSTKLAAATTGLEYLRMRPPETALADVAVKECLTDMYMTLAEALELMGHLDAFAPRARRPPLADVTRIVRDIAALVDKSWLGIDVVADVEPKLAAKGDAADIYHAILRLCLNGRDAMPNGGTLTLTAHKQAMSTFDRRRGRVVISVRDTGPGLTEEQMEALQASASEGPLAFVQDVVTNLGGKLRVESELGRGTLLDMELPLVDKPRLKRGTFVGALEPLERYRGAGVLVVHDDAVVRRSLSRVMEVWGLQVLAAPPATAVDTLRGAPQPPLIIMLEEQATLPDGSPLGTVLRRLFPQIALLWLGGRRKPGPREALLRQPWSAESLLEVLEKLLGSLAR